MSKPKRYEEEYDADNFAYQEDYEDMLSRDEVIIDEDDDELVEPDEKEDELVDNELFDFNTLPVDAHTFDAKEFDWDQIMSDYHSGKEFLKTKAIEQAVYAMDALVKFVINRHYPTYREKHYEDMLQEGRMAVVDTLGGFTGKCAPSSYFYTTIRHQIQVYIAEIVHRTTRHYAAMANKIRKAELVLAQIDGKERHDDLTISIYTGLPLTTVIETRRQTTAADFVELNPNIDTDSIENDDSNPVVAVWKTAKTEAINAAIDRLLPTEAHVIRLMYGIDGGATMNPPAIARHLNLKTDQVRKIAQDACRKLGQDKKLMQALSTHDRLIPEKEKASVAMPFVNVVFGQHVNFFDDISDEEADSDEIQKPEDLFKPMQFNNSND